MSFVKKFAEEKKGQGVLFEAEKREIDELIRALNLVPSSSEVPPEEIDRVKKSLPSLVEKVETLYKVVKQLQREYGR